MKRSFVGISFLMVFLLNGCATKSSSKKIMGPDGTENLLISCYEIEDCYEKATIVCNRKYKIVNTSSETFGSDGDTSTEIKLLIKCELGT
jgi:hypothetical protein